MYLNDKIVPKMGCSPTKYQKFTGVHNHSDIVKNLQQQSSSGVEFDTTDRPIETETDETFPGSASLEEEICSEPARGKISAPSDGSCETATVVDENVHGLETNTQEEQLTKETSDLNDENDFESTRNKKRQRKITEVVKPVINNHQTNSVHTSLRELLDKATQTHWSIQTLVDLLILQYEESNQILKEMVNECKQMLDHHQMPLKDQMVDRDVQDNVKTLDSPHTLQHFIHKMMLVGDSVKELDASIEDMVEYFDSASGLLGEKLLAKRTIEARLKRVLASVEAASLRKSSPEDSSLNSEDSGIGADKDCQIALRQACIQRKSSGSRVGSGSSFGRLAKKSLGDSRMQLQINIQNNWSKISHIDRRYIDIKRPQTANNPAVPCPGQPRYPGLRGPWRTQSADGLCCKLDCVVQKQDKRQNLNNKTPHSAQHGNVVPCLHPVFTPEPPGKNAVKRLISTFSQGVQDLPNQKTNHWPARFRTRRCFLSALNNTIADACIFPSEKEFSVKPEEMNLESLPPPPPEILMDSSFNPDDEHGGKTPNQRCGQRSIEQLPSKGNISEQFLTAISDDVIEDHKFGEADRLFHELGPGDQGMKPVSKLRIHSSYNSVYHRDSILPTSSSSRPVQWEAFTASTSPCFQRWTMRSIDNDNDNGLVSAKTLSTSQAPRPSCRSMLPRPWGEVTRRRVQSAAPGQCIKGSSYTAYRLILNNQRTSLSNISEPHGDKYDGNTSADER